MPDNRPRLVDKNIEETPLPPPSHPARPSLVLADSESVAVFCPSWNINKTDSALDNFHISKKWVERSVLPVDSRHITPMPASQLMNVVRDNLYSLTAHTRELLFRLEASSGVISKQENALRSSEEENKRLKHDLHKLKDSYSSKKKEIALLKEQLKASQEAEATAVQRYMKSSEGRTAIATFRATSLVKGFRICKDMLKKQFPEGDFSQIQFEGAKSDEDEEKDEEEDDKEAVFEGDDQRRSEGDGGDDGGEDEVQVVGEKTVATSRAGEEHIEEQTESVEKNASTAY